MWMRRSLLTALTLVSLTLFATSQARAVDPEKYFPDNTDTIVKVNLNQILGSKLLHKGIPLGAKKYGDAVVKMMMERAPLDEQTKQMAGQFLPTLIENMDEEKVTQFMTLGQMFVQDFVFVHSSRENDNTPQVIMIIRSQQIQPAMMDNLGQIAQFNPQVEIKEEKVGEVTVIEINSKQAPQPFFICVPEEGIMVMSPFKNVLHNSLKKKGQGKMDPEFKKLLGQSKPSYSVFAAGLAPKNKADEFKHYVGTLTLDQDITGNLTVECKDAETAQAQVTKANESLENFVGGIKQFAERRTELKPLLEALNKAKPQASGNTVTAKLSLKGDEILKAIENAKQP
jgi:hypothetical protein